MSLPKKRARLSLTPKQLSTADGQSLLDLLHAITDDGELKNAEIESLREWLANHEAPFAGALHLREEIAAAVADGSITDAERTALHKEILRVMPPDSRYDAESNRLAHQDKIAAVQISNRQKMVLRFWGKEIEPGWNRGSVSAWLDKWYDEDPWRLIAWEECKRAIGDRGGQGDPMKVPFNCGPQFLALVQSDTKGEPDKASLASSPAKSGSGCAAILVVGFVGVGALGFYFLG